MKFRDLYNLALSETSRRMAAGKYSAVTFAFLRDRAVQGIPDLIGVNVEKVQCEPGDPQGHFVLYAQGESAYEEPEGWVALITVDLALPDATRNFVKIKELMHVFDEEESLVSDDATFRNFLDEIEFQPISERTAQYNSENRAKWMALLCLCPSDLRIHWKALINSGARAPYDCALALNVPPWVASQILSDSYDSALTHLLDDDCAC